MYVLDLGTVDAEAVWKCELENIFHVCFVGLINGREPATGLTCAEGVTRDCCHSFYRLPRKTVKVCAAKVGSDLQHEWFSGLSLWAMGMHHSLS